MEDLDTLVKEELVLPTFWPFGTDDFFVLSENPFMDKLPDPRAFVGYDEEVKDLLRCIRTRTNAFVLGSQGTGKTAMCKSIHETIVRSAKNYRSVFIRVQKARFEKELAKEMLKSIGGDYREYSSVAELYKEVLAECEKLHSKGITVVAFLDEIVNAGNGALRQVLYLIPDVLDYQPVLIFNGTYNMPNQIKKSLPSLIDRIGEVIHLGGFKSSEDVKKLVNARIRLCCKLSDFNNGSGCKRKQSGQITCADCLGPFSGEVVGNAIEKVGTSPRNLVDFFKGVVEKAAESKRFRIDENFADESSRFHFKKQLSSLTEGERRVVEYLFKGEDSSDVTLNSIAKDLDFTNYTLSKIIEDLMEKHLVILKLNGESTLYRLTPQARKVMNSMGGF